MINLANKITLTRILLIPFFVMFILYGRLTWALAVFSAAMLSDAIDGFIARRLKIQTKFGAIIDPLADKFLILSGFICMAFANDPKLVIRLPLYVAIIVIFRDAVILIGSMVIYIIKGDLEVRPSAAGKITTALQMLTILCVLIQFKYSVLLANITVFFTIFSMIDYMRAGSRSLNNNGGGTAHA